MRALTLAHTGEPEQMSITEIPTPEPGPGQLRLSVTACGLNPTDYQRARHGVPDWQWPAVLGLDPAGVVDAVGEGVEGFAVGDRVVAVGDIRERGGFAEHTVVDVDAAARIPDEVSDVAAAAIPSGGLTAWDAVVEKLRVGPEDLVVITGASGGVGGIGVQLAHAAGAEVIAVASERHRERCLDLGTDRVVDYRGQDVPAAVREIAGADGVDAVLDVVGEQSATALLGTLGFGGRIATTAGRPDLTAIDPFTLGPSVHEITLGFAYLYGARADIRRMGRMLTRLLARVADGTLDPMVGRTVGLAEVPETLGALSRGELTGKAVYAAG